MTNRYVVNVFLTPDFYYGKSGSLFALTSSGGLFRYSFETTVEVILTVGKNEVIVNGEKKTIEAPPYIKNGRTMVPVRVISEAFGADVGWNDKTKEVTIRYKDKNIILKIGSPYALVNGTQTPIDRDNLKVVPEITNGRTFVPIRFISETFGAKVEWNDLTQQIRITLGG
jgi:Copper amine oxidase N-terminal domain.